MSQPKSFEDELETPETEMEATTERVDEPEIESVQVDEPVQKQKPNIYTVMLLLSFSFIAIASLLLYLEARQWGDFPWWRG